MAEQPLRSILPGIQLRGHRETNSRWADRFGRSRLVSGQVQDAKRFRRSQGDYSRRGSRRRRRFNRRRQNRNCRIRSCSLRRSSPAGCRYGRSRRSRRLRGLQSFQGFEGKAPTEKGHWYHCSACAYRYSQTRALAESLPQAMGTPEIQRTRWIRVSNPPPAPCGAGQACPWPAGHAPARWCGGLCRRARAVRYETLSPTVNILARTTNALAACKD